MKREKQYHKTVDVLVQSYLNDTLQHSNCHACAVGNLVASAMGLRVIKNDEISWERGESPSWQCVFYSNPLFQATYPNNYFGDAKRQIDRTGYSWEELAQIERAFEIVPLGNSKDEWMFNGLMAVIEVLDIIHENADSDLTSTSKSKFKKEPCNQ